MRKSIAITFLNILLVFGMVLMLCTIPNISYAAQEFTVKTDGGDAVSIFGNLNINNKISGSVVVIFGNADIAAEVDGDVVSILGRINLSSSVSGDVVNVLGKITMNDNAVVGGDLVSIGTTDKAAGAKINGQQVEINTSALRVAKALITIILAFIVLISGLLVVAISKDRYMRCITGLDNYTNKKILLGFITFLGAFILSGLLGITVVAPLVFILLMLIAEITAGIYFGRQILKVFDLRLSIYLEFVLGLIFITFIKLTLTLVVSQYNFITYLMIYVLFSIFTYSLGLGILVDNKFGLDNKIAKKTVGISAQETESRCNSNPLIENSNIGGNPDENK